MEYNLKVLDRSSVGLRDSRTEDDRGSLDPWDRAGLNSLHAVHSAVGLRDREGDISSDGGPTVGLVGSEIQLQSTTVATSN